MLNPELAAPQNPLWIYDPNLNIKDTTLKYNANIGITTEYYDLLISVTPCGFDI